MSPLFHHNTTRHALPIRPDERSLSANLQGTESKKNRGEGLERPELVCRAFFNNHDLACCRRTAPARSREEP